MSALARLRRVAAALTMTAAALALPAHAQEPQRHPYTVPHVLRFASGEDLVGLNPHFNQQATLGYLAHMTMAYLVRYDRRNRPIPGSSSASAGTSRRYFAPYSSGGILDTGKYDVTNFAWGTGALGDFTSTYDEARQRRDSWFAQAQIARDVPTMVMYARCDAFAYNTDLKNFHLNQASSFDDMMDVDI